MNDVRSHPEQSIHAAWARGDFDAATTLALDVYGQELLGFLIARLGEQGGYEVFSDFLVDFWRGLPEFAWRSSLRGWAYTVARHAMSRHLRSARRRRARVGVTSADVAAMAEIVRTRTAAHLRTEVKDRFRELRTRMSDDDQTLLLLRVDRNLSWRELAQVMSEPGAELDERELEVAAARWRQRFKSAKSRLRKLAEAEGLLSRR